MHAAPTSLQLSSRLQLAVRQQRHVMRPRCHLPLVPLGRARRRRNALQHLCQRSKGQLGVPVRRVLTCCAAAAAAAAAPAAAAVPLRLLLPLARLREARILHRGKQARGVPA